MLHEEDGLVPDGPMSARASSDVRDRLLDLRVDTAAELMFVWALLLSIEVLQLFESIDRLGRVHVSCYVNCTRPPLQLMMYVSSVMRN